ncbi:MAG: hypothetical protein ACT4P5_18145 [Armatimonadota bacterium]
MQTVYLVACSAFLLLSLPPEIGRLDLRDANLLLAFLVVQNVGVTYLCSAIASSELFIEGEKGLPDLALSAFSPRTIAVGKTASGAAYALYLLGIALPLVVLATALRGARLAPIVWVGSFTAAVATAAGAWGAWLSGRFSSDFTRSFVHWVILGAIFGGTALLPGQWWPASPLRLIDETVRHGATGWLAAAAAVYLALAACALMLMWRQVRHARSQEGGG